MERINKIKQFKDLYKNMKKILSLTEKSEIRMKVHGKTYTYRFSEHPEKDDFELYVVVNNKLQEDKVYGLSCMDMDDVVLTLMQDYRDGIIEEVGYVKTFEQERDEFHQVYTKLTSMIPAYVSGNAEFKMYNLLDTLENLHNEQKHSNPSTQKENEVYLRGYFYFKTNASSVEEAVEELEELGLNMDNASEIELRDIEGNTLDTLEDKER